MKYLLDVSVLLAWNWPEHVFHKRVVDWDVTSPGICPITELGFLRISCQAYGASVDQARQMLAAWKETLNPKFITCDVSALTGTKPPNGAQTTDYYLANLAEEHGLRWATLDASSKHPAAFVIPA